MEGCCSAKRACLIFGSVYLVGGLLLFGWVGSKVGTERRKNTEDPNEENKLEDINHYIHFLDLFLALCWVIVASLLLFGVCKANSRFLTPTLVLIPPDSLAMLINVVVFVANFGFLHPLVIAFNIIRISGIVVNIFFFWCVFHHRNQIKEQLSKEK
eukprot:GFUD01020124.1.p1 GENE.GFUD01020124.1~~GFUD01020124.1.p1  ORF type:complete len:156 (+),score=23.67 GFUD01020124.1:138-605(+)